MNCPLCKADIDALDRLVNPYWQPDALALAHKLNPAWQESEGWCRYCFDLLVDQVYQLKNPTPKPKPSGQGLAHGFWYVLSERESALWNHQNPQLQRWWQNTRVEELSNEAYAEGFTEWYMFDSDERLLAQGRVGE